MKNKCLYMTIIAIAAILLTGMPAVGDQRFDKNRSGFMGGGIGYAHQFGKTYEIDVVSGATVQSATEESFSEPGIATALYGDFGIVKLGAGTFGLRLGAEFSAPGPYISFSALPRFRLEFKRQNASIGAISPWIGVGISAGWMEPFQSDLSLQMTVSLGTDFRIKTSGWYIGGQLDTNMVNFKASTQSVSTNGASHDYESRWDNILLKVLLSYRFY